MTEGDNICRRTCNPDYIVDAICKRDRVANLGVACQEEKVSKQGFRVMDSDLHVLEPGDMYQKYLEGSFRDRAPVKTRPHVAALEKWEVEGRVLPYWIDNQQAMEANASLQQEKEQTPLQAKAYKNNFDAVTTLEAMDLEGVDVAILYRTIGGIIAQAMDTLDADFSAALCRAYNNWLSDYCSQDRSRLKGAGLVSLQNIEAAVSEVGRMVNDLGFVGVSVHPDPAKGRFLYDPEVDPLWKEIESQGLAVGIHGTSTGPAEDDLTRKFLDHPAGRVVQRTLVFPWQLMSSMSGVLVSGVIQRFPDIRIAFLEGNCGWLPWMMYRLDEQWEKHGSMIIDYKPSEYFLSNCYISVDVDEELVADVIQHYGDDNIVLSTDYPHYDSAFPEAINTFLGMNLSETAKRKILWDNCERFYGDKISR